MTSPVSRKVAVALDPGSEETEYTIDWIIENFLKPDRDDVHLVSALYLNSDFDVTDLGMNINYAPEYVKKWENEINCKVEIIKTQSDSRNLIVDYTENEKVDVLVMGTMIKKLGANLNYVIPSILKRTKGSNVSTIASQPTQQPYTESIIIKPFVNLPINDPIYSKQYLITKSNQLYNWFENRRNLKLYLNGKINKNMLAKKFIDLNKYFASGELEAIEELVTPEFYRVIKRNLLNRHLGTYYWNVYDQIEPKVECIRAASIVLDSKTSLYTQVILSIEIDENLVVFDIFGNILAGNKNYSQKTTRYVVYNYNTRDRPNQWIIAGTYEPKKITKSFFKETGLWMLSLTRERFKNYLKNMKNKYL
ncbi:11322_t:CDS:2 [Entrophospora sp. SA101]|nr:4884_t:CDS:2 [Entrophospora sp. SA101]CAJ0828604.1 4303_t:CDS:2 [Entrophospora sp. SA101]CAJ0832184.1 8796_t:CDS:2 [Entrophospora sp. SA101]CAJ0841306.1 11322_t:CDS:2 [Entrophospora sp. SA101]CAJ0843818.1 11727_t:CDS:2 [Entrophospora sp. SA101]